MATITLGTLRTRVLARAQMDADDPGADDLDGAINAGCKYVRSILRRYRPAGFNINKTPETFVTVADTQTVNLPAAIETLEGVDVQVNGQWYPAQEFDFADRHKYGASKPWSVNSDGFINAFYTVMDDAIFFQDPPDAIYNGRFWLSEVFTSLAAEATTVQLWGHEEAVIDFAAQICLENDELDASHLERSVAKWRREIEQLAKRRKRGSHAAVRDVTGATSNLRAVDRERVP